MLRDPGPPPLAQCDRDGAAEVETTDELAGSTELPWGWLDAVVVC